MPNAPIVLAFDTSGPYCAVAICDDSGCLYSQKVEMPKGQAENLVPQLVAALETHGVNWGQISALAVGVGPGNFTGVRISVSFARGLAMSLGIKAVGVSNFEVVAHRVADHNFAVAVPMQRGQAAVQRFSDKLSIAPPIVFAATQLEQAAAELGVQFFWGGEQSENFTDDSHLPIEDIASGIGLRALWHLHRGSILPRPAPLYLHGADAAPPRDPAVKLLA
jgi:tRNA threonylcarbamoyladenosine biosynthesis protein TsaB